MKPIDYKKFNKEELVHLLHDVIGDVTVMNHFKKCWDFQRKEAEKNISGSCWECRAIGRKLNIIE